jgi:hypothetical protein
MIHMNKDQFISHLRAVLKFAAGYGMAKGYFDASFAEAASAFIVGVGTLIWAHFHHGESDPTVPVTVQEHQIMNTLKSLLILVIPAALIGFTVGCAHTPTGQVDVAATVKNFVPAAETAAYVGTKVALTEHPEWRDGFVQANAELQILASAENPDYTTLAEIVSRLPVEELKSEEATLAITSGEIILQQYGRPDVVTSKLVDIRPIVQAIQRGVSKGLGQTK